MNLDRDELALLRSAHFALQAARPGRGVHLEDLLGPSGLDDERATDAALLLRDKGLVEVVGVEEMPVVQIIALTPQGRRVLRDTPL